MNHPDPGSSDPTPAPGPGSAGPGSFPPGPGSSSPGHSEHDAGRQQEDKGQPPPSSPQEAGTLWQTQGITQRRDHVEEKETGAIFNQMLGRDDAKPTADPQAVPPAASAAPQEDSSAPVASTTQTTPETIEATETPGTPDAASAGIDSSDPQTIVVSPAPASPPDSSPDSSHASPKVVAVSSGKPATSGKPLVRLVDLHKAFGSHRVLDGVSLDFYPGQTTVIIGPSGTGKSVLLKHIAGLLRPDRGEVWFADQRVDQLPEDELVAIRRQMGFLFQMGALFDSMTVGENIMFPLVEHERRMSHADRVDRCKRMLAIVGLSGIEHKMPADLSGGQKKRVALARAIALEPKLVLYDEPTTGLDPIRSDVINELILRLTRKLGIASIVVTHDMASADKIADRMVMLYDGHVVVDDAPEAIHRSQDDLVKRFIAGQADEDELQAIRQGLSA